MYIDTTPRTGLPATTPEVVGAYEDRYEEILTPEALTFLARLDGAFAGRRAELLAARRERAHRIRAGETLGFPPRDRERPGRSVLEGVGSRAGSDRSAL